MSTNRPLFDPATGFPVFEPTGAFRPVFGEPAPPFYACDHINEQTWAGPEILNPLRTITFADLTGSAAVWNGTIEYPPPDPALFTWTHSHYWDETLISSHWPVGRTPGLTLGAGSYSVWLAKPVGESWPLLQFALWIRWWPLPQVFYWIIHFTADSYWESRRWYKTHVIGESDSAGTYTRWVGADGSCVVS
jgi:hypothetical protein